VNLTAEQIENITTTIRDANQQINELIFAREDLHALMRIHEDAGVTDPMATVVRARLRAKTAADALAVLFA
jgi:hypothetical protein